MRKGTVGGMVIGVVLIAAIVLGYMCMQRVPAGYVGVVYEMSGGVGCGLLLKMKTFA